MTNTCPLHLLTQSATHNKHAYKPYPSYITNQHFSQLGRSKHPQNILWIFFSSFNVRKWATNSKKIQTFIDNQFEENKTSEGTNRKVLGITWDIQSDNFLFDFTDIIGLCNTLEPTKRNILRIQGMFHDPLELISPITLPINLVLQKLFELKFEWDTNIDAD